jgi:hypothetical protein
MQPLPVTPSITNPLPSFLSVVHWPKLVPPNIPVIVSTKPAAPVP